MHWTHPRQTFPRTLVGWRAVWIGLGLLLTAWPAMVLGQGYPPAPQSPYPPGQYAPAEGEEPFWLDDRFSGQSGRSLGVLIRGGAVVGEGVGRTESFFPVELMPYFFVEDGVFFTDIRGLRGVADRWGFNAGVGYRHYIPAWDRIFGINAFYDSDDLAGAVFRQYGVGLETLGPGWDMRLNTYFPTGRDKTNLEGPDALLDTLRYVDNRILFDQLRIVGTALRGLDHEIGVPLPGRWLRQHDVRGFAGWYHFQNDDLRTWGWKGRLQGDLTPNIQLGLDVTNDKLFDTNVFMTVAFQYGGFRQPEDRPRSQFDRMTTPIQRNYNVVVARTPVIDKDLVALKANGQPYFVEHVANDPDDPNLAPFIGTVENPYLTIAQAQAAPGGDIIFVHTNSQYTGINVVTEQGVRILGEADGVVHTFFLANTGQTVPLPRANNAPDDVNDPDFVPELRPLFRDIPDDGVTLASGFSDTVRTEFSGFRLGVAEQGDELSGTERDGIVGNDIQFVTVRLNDVSFAGRDGVSLSNIETQTVNSVFFEGNRILNAARHGLLFFDSTGDVTFRGDPNMNVALIPEGGQSNAYLDVPFSIATLGFNPLLGTRDNPDPLDLPDDIDPGDPTGAIAGDAVRILNTGPESNLRMGGGNVTIGSPKPAVIVYGDLLQLDDGARLGPEYPTVIGGVNPASGGVAGGIFVNNAQGSATFGIVRIANTHADSAGIEITNSSGNYVFTDFFQGTSRDPDTRPEVVVSRASLEGITIENLLAGGSVTFDGSVQIIDRRSHGVNLLNNVGDVAFNELLRIVPRSDALQLDDSDPLVAAPVFDNFAPVFDRDRDPNNATPPIPNPNISYVISTTAPAIEYQESSGNATFRDVQLVSGEGNGILIGRAGTAQGDGNTGAFTISRSVDIINMDSISLLIESDDATVDMTNLSIAYRGDLFGAGNTLLLSDQGIVVRDHRASVTFNAVSITNENLSRSTAIELLRNNDVFDATVDGDPFATITFNEQTSIRGALGDIANRFTPVAGVAISQNATTVTFDELQVVNGLTAAGAILQTADGYALYVREEGSLFTDGVAPETGLRINAGVIVMNDFDAIDIAYSNINVRFDSVSSFDPIRNGIRLVNNVAFSPDAGSVSAAAFAVSQTIATAGALQGGIIDGAPEDGIFIANSGDIVIQGMTISDSAEEGIDHRVQAFLVNPDNTSRPPLAIPLNQTQLENLIGVNDYLPINPNSGLPPALLSNNYFSTGITPTEIQNSVIRSELPHSLLVAESLILDNGESGIQTIDVHDVTIQDTVLLDNGSIATVGTNPLSNPFLASAIRQDFLTQPGGLDAVSSTVDPTTGLVVPGSARPDDDDSQIQLVAADLTDPLDGSIPIYSWTLLRNQLSQTAPFSAIRADTTNGARGVTLNFFVGGLDEGLPNQLPFTDITMQLGTNNNVAAVDIRWDGQLNANIRNSLFTLLDDTSINQAGIRIANSAFNTQQAFDNVITIEDNSMEIAGFAAFGVEADLTGTSSIVIQGTTTVEPFQVINEPGQFQRMIFTGDLSTGISLNLRQSTQSFVNQNIIRMLGVEEGTGIIFDFIRAPSTATLNGNIIEITGFDFFNDERGIVFDSVSGTINLQGVVNNSVNLNGFFLSVPNWFIFNGNPPFGTILVNGTAVP